MYKWLVHIRVCQNNRDDLKKAINFNSSNKKSSQYSEIHIVQKIYSDPNCLIIIILRT